MPATLEIAADVLPPETRGPGRPSLLAESTPAIVAALREGNTEDNAARLAGVHPKTLSRWKGENEDFAESLAGATAEYLADVRRRLKACRTNSGSNDPKAIELEVRRFAEFQSHQVTETRNLSVSISLTGDQLASIQAKRRQALEDGK